MSRPAFELADIVKLYKTDFTGKHQPLKQHLSVLHAIEICRTAMVGGHVDGCDNCGHLRISYNGCRNRHCPKCQGTNRERWIVEQQENLLPVKYFHVVFTLPHILNKYCMHHPALMYAMLFHASKETIIQFGKDPRHLGAQMGMISVLHTWGQQLSLHPHIHMIIPGGGITAAGHWKNSKQKGKYLFCVKAMSKVFQGKFMEAFLKMLKAEGLQLDKTDRDKLYEKPWIVYAKEAFGGPDQVLKYLGRYTHKIAISNHRIKAIDDGKVSFAYKDYGDGGQQKIMTLDATEFLRRFCLHILPPGFMKIRHYGILSNRGRSRLNQIKLAKFGIIPKRKERIDWKIIAKEKMNFDADVCPCCKTGKMINMLTFDGNAPPLFILKHYAELQKQQAGKTHHENFNG